MNKQNKPEMMIIEDENFDSHNSHWTLLTSNPSQDVPQWLGTALDAPIMPMGICPSEQEMNPATWLIQGPSGHEIQVSQIIQIENHKPKALCGAFPSFYSPYHCTAKITRIISCPKHTQAVLQLELDQDGMIYAFDSLYSVNHLHYQQDQYYQVHLNAWAYELEAVSDSEQLVLDDPASIKHHRALNQILAEHNGVEPDNLQELIEAWEPQSEDDLAPVTIDYSEMVAYFYGDTLGQEDEAWFQAKIVGKSSTEFMQQKYCFYDVTLIAEPDQPAILTRIATANPKDQDFEIGDYIRGNIWLQAQIFRAAS